MGDTSARGMNSQCSRRTEIEELLFRSMRSFDDKDWDAMRECLAESIHCDYSSFRGTPPGDIARDDYIGQRAIALAALKTQHNLSNLSIEGTETHAEAICNYAILRFAPDFDGTPARFFHSYGQYQFGVVMTDNQWRIISIRQSLLVSDGNPELHAGARSKQGKFR